MGSGTISPRVVGVPPEAGNQAPRFGVGHAAVRANSLRVNSPPNRATNYWEMPQGYFLRQQVCQEVAHGFPPYNTFHEEYRLYAALNRRGQNQNRLQKTSWEDFALRRAILCID